MELWRWHLGPGEGYDSHPHPAGFVETVTVIAGGAVITVDGTEYPIGDGMTATFAADVSHSYQGGPAGVKLLMTVHLPASNPKGQPAP